MEAFRIMYCIGMGVVFVLFLLPHIATFVYLRKRKKGNKR